jgi:hypothetical protein
MPVTLGPHLGERGHAVIGIFDVVIAELLEQITDDADHRAIIVDNEDRHRQINRHAPLAGPMRPPAHRHPCPCLTKAVGYQGALNIRSIGHYRKY